MRKILFCLMIAVFMIIGCKAKQAQAMPGLKEYQASWTANTETDLAGYYLYWRTATGSFNDTNRVQCAKTATTQKLTGVVPNNTTIALTAFDNAGNESAFSATVPFVADGTAPGSPNGLAVTAVP